MKKGFLTYAYHLVRRYTRTKKLRLISTYYKQGNLLDIGCGTGEFLDRCRKAGFTTVGIEPNLEARNYAMKVYKLDVRDEGALNDLNNSSFEVITMWHALEHMHKLNEMVIEICRLLKPNGTLFIAVPNCTSMDAAIYKTYWAAYDVPRHLYHFTPADITKLFEKHSMRIESILPMWFDSFYVSMMSEKYKKGMMIRALWNGFRSNLAALRTRQTFSSQLYVIKK
ncbi:MAG: class I SAM-dependent methyltransferase [Ignavibacteriae bacterium]|nr:class I SAM-dependent methyltransferase [Ignavibacteriota bacterium]